MLMRMPFALWDVLGGLAEMLPQPPFTRNQVELMKIDTTASDKPAGVPRTWNFDAITRRRTRSDTQAKQIKSFVRPARPMIHPSSAMGSRSHACPR